MLTVATVLKSGGDFLPEHVAALREGIARHLALPHRFLCVTDMEVDCEHVGFWNDWPGWWSKLEIFRTGLFVTPTVYFDLDTVITGSLDNLVLGHRFTALEDWYHPSRINSSMMAWDCDLGVIYRTFERNAAGFMEVYRTREKWGDQAFIEHHSPVPMDRWQPRYPGKVVSFKKHVRPNRGVPEGAAVCCFHGVPRPWTLPLHQREWFAAANALAA